MKSLLPAALLLVPLTAAAVARPPGAEARSRVAAQAQDAQAQQGLEQRVAALENELAAERRRHEETRELLAKTLAYLDEQARGAETLLGKLTESEDQGFAVGENWQSRETLLAGLRAYWGAKATNLPKAPVPAPAVPAPKAPVSKRAAPK